MPTDALTFSITGSLAEKVRAAAEAEGLTPDEFVRQEMADSIEVRSEASDLGWEEDYRRLAEPGVNVPLDQAFDRLDAQIKAARAKAK